MEIDSRYMRRALQLALNGLGQTSPNPMVGAVIVHRGKIIGEGFHRRFSESHAEVNAINSVRDRGLLPESTMYVTLEPCSHYGKTPPCASLIIDSKIKRVVVGTQDPFEQVKGRGIRMLEQAGVRVVKNLLEEECLRLNRPFITAHTLKRPFVTLKWAQSNDGFMDRSRESSNQRALFSTPLSLVFIHKLRSVNDAILTGSGTVIADDPRLDCRAWHGRTPRCVILDRSGKVPSTAKVFSNPQRETVYFTSVARKDLPTWVKTIAISRQTQLEEVLGRLYSLGVTSVLVEGGGRLLRSFIAENLWDAARIEISPFNLGEKGAVPAPEISKIVAKEEYIGENRIIYHENDRLFGVKNL